MIFAPSPRRIAWSDARAIAEQIDAAILPVGVFVNPSYEDVAQARALFPELVVQLSGEEPPDFAREIGGNVIKAIHVDTAATSDELEARCNRYAGALVLFDTKLAGAYGGTGERFDWSKIARIARTRDVVVAGGLDPENVGACVRDVRPAWVDVRSGIETAGRKDEEKMIRFVAAVRENDEA